MTLIYQEESYAIIGAAQEVHSNLGSGFLEAVYQEAMEMELTDRNIPFISQKELEIKYKNRILKKKYYADIICYDRIIIELKTVKSLLPEHIAQVMNYLKASDMKLGLLFNFASESLELKRIVL